MARRVKRYPEDRHEMRIEIRERFFSLMDPDVVKKLKNEKKSWNNPKWNLWRWDTLEDVPALNV